MARRTELRGIANSLNGSFVSRNNEFGGYWSIGQLKLFVAERGLTSVGFSFPMHKHNTSVDLMNHIARRYTSLLAELLMIQRLPDSWVKDVIITVDFDTPVEATQLHDIPTVGEPFKCLCQIVDDNGRLYSSAIYGRCQPHSTAKELRSLREQLP
ncbi:hypothetical protein OH773_10200 [Buttiauxella sp. WJP83]|uniref:hypothetical protein n=1 Tax=Buttiauxella sp. WJP83 TaxID=2986951 RepID=UPI0022DD2FEC|nr:hypothetical protein [Buttiauxella sp. WJP83]WBM72573.1 hypothetical protein OH773_10200 [Buttiauxella sp. WJP83]